MSKRIVSSLVVVLTLFVLVGCFNNQKQTVPPDKGLLAYLPTIKESYIGDSGYYHVIEKIERESTKEVEIAKLSGEVKDNTTTNTRANFDFEIILAVDAEKIVQTYIGSQLNESNFEKLVLLSLPIEVGNTWTFKTEDHYGENSKVTGEIIAIDPSIDEIVVRHSTKDGYYEERVMQKGRGVTDFVRMLIFKNESTFTGYHAEHSSVSVTETTELPVDALKIPVAYYNLILGFEQAWSSYVKQDNDDLLKFLSVDSPAFEKIKAVSRDANTAIEFVRFYPYEFTEIGSMLAIKVVEIFKTVNEETTENKVLFQIVIEKGVAKIYDFEAVK